MRRFRRYPPWPLWACVVLSTAIAGRYWWTRGNNEIPHVAEGSSQAGRFVPGEFEVVRIERGDLLIIRQRVPGLAKDSLQVFEGPLQLLGVKTSTELEAGKQFSSEFLSRGQPSLDLDRRRLDNSGHFLAYVSLNGRLLNEELIRAGWAEAENYPGDNQTIHRKCVMAEREAKRAGRGIWTR